MGLRIIKFPADVYCGKLFWQNPLGAKDWVELDDACGEVIAPTEKLLHFWADNEEALSSLPLLADLPGDAFHSITLACTNAADDDLAHLSHFICLKGLALWETEVGDEGLLLLKSFPQLEWLDLGDTKITDSGLHHLQSLPDLRELSLLNTGVSDLGMESLAALKNLKTLDMMNTKVSDKSIAFLSSLAELRYLRIYETRITEEGYSELKRNLPGCKIRYFESNDL